MENNREIFIEKLDRFIRRYYQNLLMRGVILFILLILCYFFLVSFSEYFLFLSVAMRKSIVLFTGLWILFLAYRFLWIPSIGLFKIGKRISYRQAIGIISKHFPNLQDKLLNTLELTEQASMQNSQENSLLLASIHQRIEAIKPIPFRSAISFRSNFVYLKYLVLICVVVVSVYFLIPNLYTESSKRLVHYNTFYAPPADFSFVLDNYPVKLVKGSDFSLKFHTEGKYIPDEVYVLMGNSRFLAQKEKLGQFSYQFRNLNTDIEFQLQSGKVTSKKYSLKLIVKPKLKNSSISIQSPTYTKLPLRIEKNLGDISVPEGSKISWQFESVASSSGELIFSDSLRLSTEILEGNRLKFKRTVRENISYRIYLSNKDFEKEFYAKYRIDVVQDEFPQIAINVIQDSIRSSAFYFHGRIKDDYGFSKLRFVYQIENQKPVYIPISIQKNLSAQEFFFAYDFKSGDIREGEQLNYHFEVFDNDGIHGAKKTSSQSYQYHNPDGKQIYDLNKLVQNKLHSKLEQGMQLSESIRKDIERLQQNNLDASTEDWQQEQLMKEIAGKKKDLDQLLEEIHKENQKQNQLLGEAEMQDPETLKKQEQIDQLMKNLMNPELEKLFKEFNKLADELKSEDINKLGNQLKMSMGDFQKQLDRNLQLLQRYEIELKIQQLVDRMQSAANEQEKVADKVNKRSGEPLKLQQNTLQKWKEIEKDLSDVLKKNESISRPYQFDQNIDEDQEQIDQMMEESKTLLQQSKSGKAAKNMWKTAQNQRRLAQKLADNVSNSMAMQMSVDLANLIRLMRNTIEFSFEQEDLLNRFKEVGYRDPKYVFLLQKQGQLKDEYALIQDSLLALSAHSAQIASLIGDKIFSINSKLDRIISEAGNRRKIQAANLQQQVLTDVNELSVFLSEALKQLMEQMANAMPGDQLGEKKNGQNSFPGLKSQQESIKKMLEDLISEMKNNGGQKSSKEKIGKLLQRQEMYRNNLQEMMRNGNLSHESDKILREVMRMIDQMESDISNFSINSTIIKRQNLIISRMLEAENAEKEKDFDKKRESKIGNILKLSNPREIFEYKRVRTNFDGVFNQSNLKMFDYYNKLYLDYMIKLNND